MTLQQYYNTVAKLNIYSYHYYYLDDPIATDEEYDTLYKEVKEYEYLHPEDILSTSPTQHLDTYIQQHFNQYIREEPMLSLDNVYNQEELLTWLSNIQKKLDTTNIQYCVSPKYDGCSLELVYSNNNLTVASTRGNSLIGEDVTLNAKTIKTIPLNIAIANLTIRGEVVIKKSVFEELNKNNTFSNPRNLASGSIRQLDTSITKSRRLDFIPHTIANIQHLSQELSINSYYQLLQHIYQEGKFINYFSYFKLCSTPQEVITYIQHIQQHRDTYPITLDGVVITIDNIQQQLQLGYATKYPKFSIAYKLPPIEKVTTLKGIELQMGRTGIITPIGILQPTNIDGKTISKVTLNNYEDIVKKDIRIGDQVIIILSGDVIPKIIKSLPDRRTNQEEIILIPQHCPYCNTTDLSITNGILRCNNYYCNGQVIARIQHFTSKEGLDVKGLSKSIITTIVNTYNIKDPYEFYATITLDILINILGDKVGNKLYEKLEISKHCNTAKFISALGIPNIGSTVAKTIAKTIGLEWNKTEEELLKLLPSLNKNAIKSILDFNMQKALHSYFSIGFEIVS